MTSVPQADDRKTRERKHGAAIAYNALSVWGWGTPAGQERARRRAGLLIQRGAIDSHSNVLELGAGTGLFTGHLAHTGADVIALDLSWDLLIRARSNDDSNIHLVLADAEHLPFAPSSFNAVVGSSVLHHIEPKPALAEAYRVLRPGGRVAFAEPNMLNPQIAVQKNVPTVKHRLGDSPDETAFFRWQADHLLRQAGFISVSVEPHDFLHPLTPPFLIHTVQRLGKWLESLPLIRELAGSLIMAGQKPEQYEAFAR